MTTYGTICILLYENGWICWTWNFLRQKMHVALVFSTEITWWVMFVNVDVFLRGVRILSLCIVHSTLFCIHSCILCIRMRTWCRNCKGRKTLTDPHIFFFYSINLPPAMFGIKCHQCTCSLQRTNCVYFAVLIWQLYHILYLLLKGKRSSFCSAYFFLHCTCLEKRRVNSSCQ